MDIVSLIRSALAYVTNLVKKVIDRVLSFMTDIVGWFKNLLLDPKKDVPFIANPEMFKEKLHNAPIVNVGIFRGVYNEETEQIEYAEVVDAKALDYDTQKMLNKGEIVVLN